MSWYQKHLKLAKIEKEEQSMGGGSYQLQMGPYWKYLKKKREKGMSDGEAVLNFLKDRPLNKTKKRKKKKK